MTNTTQLSLARLNELELTLHEAASMLNCLAINLIEGTNVATDKALGTALSGISRSLARTLSAAGTDN